MKYNLNRNLLALTISGILSSQAHAAITDIIISEYVEGSGDNKAIELTNTGSASYTFPANIDLQYSSYNNQIRNVAGDNVLEGVTIPAGGTLVIYNSAADASLASSIADTATAVIGASYSEQSYYSMSFNGDDHVAIIDTDTGTTYDVIGIDGTYWGAGQTLRRRLGEGDSTPVQSSSYDEDQWEDFGSDVFDDLGTATYSAYQEEVVEPSVCVLETQTTIAEIQGDGSASPLIESGYETTETYDVTGIVTAVADYPSKGFYMQDVTVDGDPLTSDGIFVSTSYASDDMIGNTVCVNSTVAEYYYLTRLETDEWDIVDDSSSVPAATDIQMIEADAGSFAATLERYEGMLVNLPEDIDSTSEGDQDMRVTKTFGFNYDSYRNDMILAYQRPHLKPTQENVAGSDEAIAAAAENDDYTLIIESSERASDGEIPYYSDFNADPENNYIRIDDSVIGMEGVITYSYGDFSLVVTNELTSSNFVHNTDRTSSPDLDTTTDETHFAIKIGTQNLLNFFNSPYGGDANQFGDNRGADDEDEYEKQLAKLVSAIVGLDADVVGLMEIENNGFGNNSAIQTLVDAINAQYDEEDPDSVDDPDSISNRYVFVAYDSNEDLILDENDSLGSDAISTGLIYRPTKVTIDNMRVIKMPYQNAPVVVNDNNVVVKDSDGATLESGSNYQRDAITATFKVNNTGKSFTIAVNHFKSKGSTCWEEWDGVDFGEAETWYDDAPDEDLQGSCENLRVSAAVQLGSELKDIGGDTIIVGDLNAYGQEDALLVLTENPTGKTITSARDSYVSGKPQFTTSGDPQTITTTYGYINTVSTMDSEKDQQSWSYSYDDEIGSLDHILISSSMQSRLIDAVDWHINAAESALYDYNNEYKGDDTDLFYVDDEYRSSDHDSAIISLSYEYAEQGEGEPVLLTISSSLLSVPYVLAEGTLAGDIAQISLSSEEDMQDIVLPTITLTSNNQLLTEFEIYGLDTGKYQTTLTLTRDGGVMSDYTKSFTFQAVKQDSTTATIAPAEEYDGSGGSLGLFSLLSLLGLGFFRLRKTQTNQ